MPNISSNNTQEEFFNNFNRITENAKLNSSYNSDDKPTDFKLRNDLIYVLCGINTSNIQMNIDEKNTLIINPLYKNKNLIKAFEPLIYYVKNIKRFISQIFYVNDITKKMIAEYLIKRIKVYHESVLNVTEKEIEEIFAALYIFFTEFHEYDILIESISLLSDYEVLNFLYERKNTINENYYSEVIANIEKQNTNLIFRWMKFGECNSQFFIKEKKSILEFDECYWKNRYEMNLHIPCFIKKYINEIHNAGLVINTLKEMKIDLGTINENPDFEEIKFDVNSMTINNFYKNIIDLYNCNKKQMSLKIMPLIQQNLQICIKKYFMLETSELTNILDFLGNKIYLPLDSTLLKINNYSTAKFKIADTRINYYILKILNVEKNILNVKINAIENLCIENEDSILNLF